VGVIGEVCSQSTSNVTEIATVEFFEGYTDLVVEYATFTWAEVVINVIPIKDMGKTILG
jgi:hypothetical protein